MAVTAVYRESVRTWHEAAPRSAPVGPAGFPCLVLVNLNSKERAELCPVNAAGTFSPTDREHAAFLFREPGSDNAHAVSARLLAVLYTIQEHFHAGEIRLLSGYRSPWEGMSQHGKGHAADIVVPGIRDEQLAAYARTLGFVGVGVYPTSQFVHIDVRDASYFWIDSSAPGRPHRERGVLAGLAKESDARALDRGERPSFAPFISANTTTWLGATTSVDALVPSRGTGDSGATPQTGEGLTSEDPDE